MPPSNLTVDTLGAGDTFNAAVVGGVALGQGLKKSVKNACRVAGLKVGMVGLRGLGEMVKKNVDM